MKMRRVPPVMLAAALLAGVIWFMWPYARSPVQLSLLRTEPSGVMDETGAELWLLHVTVSNRGSGPIQFAWGLTEVESRVGRRWLKSQPMELLWNPGYLQPLGSRSIIMLVPPNADACRIRMSYQPEVFRWALWRKMGTAGQGFFGRFPQLVRRVWPQGRFGERPPAGAAFRQPGHWKRFSSELLIPRSTFDPVAGG